MFRQIAPEYHKKSLPAYKYRKGRDNTRGATLIELKNISEPLTKL